MRGVTYDIRNTNNIEVICCSSLCLCVLCDPLHQDLFLLWTCHYLLLHCINFTLHWPCHTCRSFFENIPSALPVSQKGLTDALLTVELRKCVNSASFRSRWNGPIVLSKCAAHVGSWLKALWLKCSFITSSTKITPANRKDEVLAMVK